ncbi:MAG TPA: alpha/beta fold hydrolase, partial [Stellaceae bacterium]|nr:alpha/beta fold hydrolase [Stellaceae bacterium]
MALRRSLRFVLASASLVLTLAAASAGTAHAVASKAAAAYGVELEGFDYPYPVRQYSFTSQEQPLSMAYMDVAPVGPPKGVVVLLHGKNFCSATWEATIKVLVDAGYRAIAPDQVGFCKSSKPMRYQFSFQQLAHNTHDLLTALRIKQPVVLLGHSTGGMLAIRYALMYPQGVARLLLVDPIGLEDWKAL